MKIFQVIEYQAFTSKKCDKRFFDSLVAFSQIEGNERFIKHHKKAGIDYLKAQNYVGVIQTKYGTLEILPKCFGEDFSSPNTPQPQEEQKDKQTCKEALQSFYADFESQNFKADFFPHNDATISARNFLIFCLKTLKNTPFKRSQLSSLHAQNTPLLEVFMQMFCYELFELVKKGIRHDYTQREENRAYLKGKLLFKEQIRHNLVHKERFFTRSDEFVGDNPSNRLIKSTLTLLKSLSPSHTTLSLINRSLEIFEEIPQSRNIPKDFLSCTTSRHFSYYETILAWCKVFLEGQSFSAYSGESKAYALLFPMERLFESYVAYMLRSNQKSKIHAQKSDKYLLYDKNHKGYFQLKVDLHIQKEDKVIIADTKWKALKNTEDISQSDLYQLFAYAHYHQAQEVWLIYPKLHHKDNQALEISQECKAYKHHITLRSDKLSQAIGYKIPLKILFAPLRFF
ncbi:McrC family protein [Helicobacter brantae]|uniref:Restriction endonuclease n=1 Tax=Helicobacter brantae TaxID=375927 RepID=A0A3D8J195_9HELI|nr:McrC family protein [Helicobacter brantae]RDU70945.1 restriction endonuclease [Helicobacter brantae]